ncbi:hypothetical protein ACFQV2_33435 [Actinokineospora soli]|uniref:Apolipoprotein N-acyltransferase n=1 Tax=Actinokineospora soli TaxID=1048753 RepID=A0ABW2TXY2_9PSEU
MAALAVRRRGTAAGLAVIGAFAPLAHLVLVLVALGGFVLVPGSGRRRGVALFMLVLMPLALLLPWPAVVIQNPGVVVHGFGALVANPATTAADLVALHPGGPGAWPFVGALVVLAVLAGALVRPGRAALPGLGFAALGGLALALVLLVPMTPLGGATPSTGWAGTPLLIIGWGLVWALLGLCRTGGGKPALVRPAAAIGVAALGALASGVVVAGPVGPLTDGGGTRMASSLTAELADTQRWVLTLDGPPRLTAARLPAFGDDDLAPAPGAAARLGGLRADLLSGESTRVRAALARAAAAGVLFVITPADAAPAFRVAAGDLAGGAPRPPTAGPSSASSSPRTLRAAVTRAGQDRRHRRRPPTSLDSGGVVPVDATPPGAAARVSDGPDGRLLVVGANEEPGWTATVNGRQVPVVRAWGHQVAVPVPTRAADVRVEHSSALRGVLLLVQGAMVLFTVLTSIPGRRPD